MNLQEFFENLDSAQQRVRQLPAKFQPPQTSPQLSGTYPGRNATRGYLVGESSDQELYGLRIGDTVMVRLDGGSAQGDIIDIYPDTQEVELLLRGPEAGRTITVDVRDTQALDEQGVAEGHADQQRKIFKKNGQPVGEVGIDRESSPGVGQYYMKHYASGTDNSGYDSFEEALGDLRHVMKQSIYGELSEHDGRDDGEEEIDDDGLTMADRARRDGRDSDDEPETAAQRRRRSLQATRDFNRGRRADSMREGVAEATGDKPFDTMMSKIKKGTKQQARADRRARDAESRERARAAFGPSPADKLSIRPDQGVAEATGNPGMPHDFTAVQPGAEVWYKGRFAGWTTGKVYDDPYGKHGKMVAFEPNPSEFPGDEGRILALPYDEVSLRKSTSIGKLKGPGQGVAEGSIDYDDNQYSITDAAGKELTMLRGNTPEEAIERAKQLIGSNEKLLATFGLVKLTPRPHYIVRNAKRQGVAEGRLREFAPTGSSGGQPPRPPRVPGQDPWDGADPGEDPYKYPKPEHYSRAIDFFERFEADHFDKEDMDDATGTFKGYWYIEGKPVQIASFKWDDPRRTGDGHPGMGWYFEPQDPDMMESRLREFDAGESGFGPWRLYQRLDPRSEPELIGEYPSLAAAEDEMQEQIFYAAQKNALLYYDIIDGTGERVSGFDPDESADSLRRSRKIQGLEEFTDAPSGRRDDADPDDDDGRPRIRFYPLQATTEKFPASKLHLVQKMAQWLFNNGVRYREDQDPIPGLERQIMIAASEAMERLGFSDHDMARFERYGMREQVIERLLDRLAYLTQSYDPDAGTYVPDWMIQESTTEQTDPRQRLAQMRAQTQDRLQAMRANAQAGRDRLRGGAPAPAAASPAAPAAAPPTASPGRARKTNAAGVTQHDWMAQARQQGARLIQAKMIDGPVIAIYSDGRRDVWQPVGESVSESVKQHHFIYETHERMFEEWDPKKQRERWEAAKAYFVQQAMDRDEKRREYERQKKEREAQAHQHSTPGQEEFIAPHGDARSEVAMFRAGNKPAALINSPDVGIWSDLINSGRYVLQRLKLAGQPDSYVIGQPGEEERVEKIHALVQNANDRAQQGDFSPFQNSNYHRWLGRLLGYPASKIEQFIANYFRDTPDRARARYDEGQALQEIQQKLSQQIAAEDVLGGVRQRLGDMIQAKAAQRARQMARRQPPQDVLGKPRRRIDLGDGKILDIHGNEDDGFRIYRGTRAMPTQFATLEEAEVAARIYEGRRAAANDARPRTSQPPAPAAAKVRKSVMPVQQPAVQEKTDPDLRRTARTSRIMQQLRARYPEAQTDLEALLLDFRSGQAQDRRDITRLDFELDTEEAEIDSIQQQLDKLRDRKNMAEGQKDACYSKVKSRYRVWPSAYASGALVQCRKQGAQNWGTGGKKKT